MVGQLGLMGIRYSRQSSIDFQALKGKGEAAKWTWKTLLN